MPPARNYDLHGNAPDQSDVALLLIDVITSAFFSTTLDLLLRYLKTSTLVLGGLTGDRGVLFTASDAYMRDFRLVVPSAGVASIDRAANRRALTQMRTLLGADVRPSRAVTLRRTLRPRGRAGAA